MQRSASLKFLQVGDLFKYKCVIMFDNIFFFNGCNTESST